MSADKRKRPISVYLLMFFLAFLAIGSLYGGGMLVLDPSGELLQLPISALDNAPFETFLVPGLILLMVLGVFPLMVTFALWSKPRWNAVAWIEHRFKEHWSWVASGLVAISLFIWLAVELWMVGYTFLLLIFTFVAVAILAFTLQPSTRRYYQL